MKQKIKVAIGFLIIALVIMFVLGINYLVDMEANNKKQNISFLNDYFAKNTDNINKNFAAISDRTSYSYNVNGKIKNGGTTRNLEISYMSRENIYLSKREDDNTIFYITDYSFDEIEEIYRYRNVNSVRTEYFINENLLYYSDNQKYYIYDFSIQECSEASKDFRNYNKYAYEVVSLFYDKKIILRDIEGNEIFALKYSEIVGEIIKSCDVAKFLKNNDKLDFFDIEIQGENIYMICSSSGCQIIYKYDVTENKFNLFSALDTEGITFGGRESYYFD